jgi:hypothetical protein
MRNAQEIAMKTMTRCNEAGWPGGGARRQLGASMVEFAIAGPIAILVILALVQLGLMMTAKQVLNEATFEAARMGATEHACKDDVVRALKRKMLPFYQNSTVTNDSTRLLKAGLAENLDLITIFSAPVMTVRRLNPPDSAFKDFGLPATGCNGARMASIPNDSLEYRLDTTGSTSGLSIQDANELRIQVTYAYELKVPLMKTVFGSVMCGIDSGVNGFGRGDGGGIGGEIANNHCSDYYRKGRMLITSFATVQMQSDAWQDPAW